MSSEKVFRETYLAGYSDALEVIRDVFEKSVRCGLKSDYYPQEFREGVEVGIGLMNEIVPKEIKRIKNLDLNNINGEVDG